MVDLVKIYYGLSELFNDETEILIDAIVEFTHTKYKRSNIKEKLELLNLTTLSNELNFLYDMKAEDIKSFCRKRYKKGTQLTIWDVI